MKRILLVYRRVISPVIHAGFGAHAGCRFYPTCSEFTEEAVRRMGWLRGGLYSLGRLLRCHPFSKGGYDPVENYGARKPHFIEEND